MREPRLLPDAIEAGAIELVDRVATRHRKTRKYGSVTIIVPDVVQDGMPAGDYEVVIRRKVSALGDRLKTLDNPWMRFFDQ